MNRAIPSKFLPKLFLASAVTLSIGTAQAATINFGNFDFAFGSGDELLFVDNSGAPITTGYIALYTFNEAPRSIADVLGGQLLTSVELGPANSPGGIGFINTPLTVVNDGALTAAPLYIVLGSEDDFGEVCAVLDTGLSFAKADSPPPPDAQFYTAHADDVVLGIVDRVPMDGSHFGGPIFQANVLRCIPEPTHAMLLGLAGLGLFVRRRR